MKRQFISIPVPGLFATVSILVWALGVNRSPAADFTARPVTPYVTAKDTGQRLARIGELQFADSKQHSEKQECIFVDPSKEFQTVLGIGGALTDAAAETYYKLPADKKQEALKAYLDPQQG